MFDSHKMGNLYNDPCFDGPIHSKMMKYKELEQSCCIWSFNSWNLSCWHQKRLRKRKASRCKQARFLHLRQFSATVPNIRNNTHHQNIGCQNDLKTACFRNLWSLWLMSPFHTLYFNSLWSDLYRAGLPPQAAAEAPVMTCGVFHVLHKLDWSIPSIAGVKVRTCWSSDCANYDIFEEATETTCNCMQIVIKSSFDLEISIYILFIIWFYMISTDHLATSLRFKFMGCVCSWQASSYHSSCCQLWSHGSPPLEACSLARQWREPETCRRGTTYFIDFTASSFTILYKHTMFPSKSTYMLSFNINIQSC